MRPKDPDRTLAGMVLMWIVLLGAFAALVVTLANPSARGSELEAFRSRHGLPALHRSSHLDALAASHAHDMARRGHLDHAGFFQRRGPAGAMAENVAYGYGTEDLTIRQWSRSPGHRANMLLRAARSYGLASAVAANGRRFWAMELGR